MSEATSGAETTTATPSGAGAPASATGAAPPAPAAAPPAPSAAQPKPGEKPPEEPAKPPADAWAKLRTSEEKLRREREELKAASKKTAEEKAEIDRLKAEIETQRKKLSLDGFDGDPAAFLEAHGIDYDDLTRRMLSRPAPKGAKPSKEIVDLRAELDALKKAREEDEASKKTRATEAAWSQVFGAFETEIAPPKEGDHAYELLHHEYQADRDGIRETLREMAQLAPELTVAQAAARLEEYFLNQTKSRLALRKVRALSSESGSGETKPSQQPAQQATKTGQPASGDGPRALSHVDSSERATDVAPPKPLHEMTLYERRQWEKESEARAAKALEAQGWGSRGA